MTATISASPTPKPVEPGAPPPVEEHASISRWIPAAVILAVWIVVWYFTEGTQTLALPGTSRTDLHDRLTEFQNELLAGRATNPVMQFTNAIADALRTAVEWLQRMVVLPNFPRPVPEIGWLGVVALATYVGLVVASWRIALLVAASFLSFGVLGYWEDSLDLLIITGISVVLAVVIGIPLAVLIGTSRRANQVVTPFLDFMQTMPTFVYLLPIVLFFGIGPSAAVVSTLIYALPPLIRIAGFGIREVSATTVEATDSAGQTYWQRLFKVQVPMARKTIIVGLNQTTLAALSMATLAAFVNGPGRISPRRTRGSPPPPRAWHDAMINQSTPSLTALATVSPMLYAGNSARLRLTGVQQWADAEVDAAVARHPDAEDQGQDHDQHGGHQRHVEGAGQVDRDLALFGPSRFTAITAGIVYAAPAAIKLVADGVKGVSPTTIEAGRSTGQTTWQEITKVQLPMAKGSLVLATNQGLLYVLAMTVIGGLVGAGALGYDVVYGFARSEAWGKGLAAGITIVLLGVMLDRITRAAADVRRDDGPVARRAFNLRLPIGPPSN